MAAFILTADQSVPVSVAFVDDHGNPVPAGGAMPVWATSDATLLAVVPAADGMSALVAAVGPDGAAQVSVQDSVSGIGGVLDITIVSGIAVAAVISAGTPVQTVTAPAPATP